MDKKIKVLVLGGTGMLGNALQKYLIKNENLSVFFTTRQISTSPEKIQFYIAYKSIISDLETLLSERFDYIINAIGVIRPSETQEDMYDSFFVNSYFPNILAALCTKYNSRLIHVSTDCVFDGRRGNYSDADIPDETNVYGMSKFLGEVRAVPHITLRTSIIGREIGVQRNLLDWFLSRPAGATLKGYTHVFWNGVTTLVLARIVERIIEQGLEFSKGLIQLGSKKISKYDMLKTFQDVFHTNYNIESVAYPVSDKTIISSEEAMIYFEDILSVSFGDQVKDLHKFYSI